MNAQSLEVERLEALLARVQKNRAAPRGFEELASSRDAHALPSTDVLDATVDDAQIVAETVAARPALPASDHPVLELEELPVAEPAAPASAAASAAPADPSRDFDFDLGEPPASQPAPVAEATPAAPPAPATPVEASALAAAVQLAALDVGPSLAPPASEAPVEVVVPEAPAVDPRAPRPVVLAPPKAGHGPVVAISRAASAAPSPTFGDVVQRTLSLRPR